MEKTLDSIQKAAKDQHTYPIVWLDSLVNLSQDNLDAQQLIQSSIDRVKPFNDVKLCEQYIRSISETERITLIASGRLGKEMTPLIHHLRQVSFIYIYCLDKKIHEQWAKEYGKIQIVTTKFQELINQIRLDRSKRDRNEIVGYLPRSTCRLNFHNDKFNVDLNQDFIYSQLLIDSLLQLPPTDSDKKKFIIECKNKYKDINIEIEYIKQFEDTYSSNDALVWYGKDSFIYRELNRGLCIQDIDLLFLFRFLIQDIRNEIKRSQCSSAVHVYRCQLMSREEINLFENSIDKLISINSFLSTTVLPDLALLFLNQLPTINLEHVLFDIHAEVSNDILQPFGFIKSNSNLRHSEEVLFTLGSIFRLIDIGQQTDGLWIIKLQLINDKDKDFNEIFQNFQINENKKKLSLLSFGNYLMKKNQFNQAEKFFARLLQDLSDDKVCVADCYYSLGCISDHKKLYDLSLNWHKKSLELKLDLLNEDDIRIAHSYESLGSIYIELKKNDEAISSYLRALKVTMYAYGDENSNVARCYTNVGRAYRKVENYSSALDCYKKALVIRQNIHSVNHSDLGRSHVDVAIIYSCLSKYDLALEHYKAALKILKGTLSKFDPEIGIIYCGLGLVYEQKGQLENALQKYEKAAVIYRQAYSATNSDVIQIEQHIQRISAKMK